MPGIVGLIGQKPAAESQHLVRAMVAGMMHEPFYECGTRSVPELGVYAGWTAHAGSFASRECRDNARPDVTVLMAGECVGDAGWPRVESLYRAQGDRFVSRLNGLFSGLVIDRHRRRTLLFNDRFGLERLYFHQTVDCVYFASEAKALLHVLPELRAFDEAGLRDYLTYGSTQQWRSLFSGIGVIEGGALWQFDENGLKRERYFAPAEWESQPTLSPSEFTNRLNDTFGAVLPRYVGSGEGVGISLTGGLDTRMIMSCLPETPHKPTCYTYSADGGRTRDERLAARVANARGLSHQIVEIGHHFLSEYAHHVDKNVYVTDGCSGATGAHEVYLNNLGRQLAPVRLTGNFGSEVLRSMSTLKPVGLSPDLFRADFQIAAANPSEGTSHPVTFAAFREIPWSLFPNVAAGRSQVTFRSPFLDNDVVALAYQAPEASRRSSEPSLQFVLNHDPALARIPTDRGLVVGDRPFTRAARRLFAEATFKLDYAHKEGLPSSLSALQPILNVLSVTGLLGLHKYLAYRTWFRSDVAPYVREVVTDPKTLRSPYWNAAFLRSMVDDHIAGRRNWVREINIVMTLEAVERLLLRGTEELRRGAPSMNLPTEDAVVLGT